MRVVHADFGLGEAMRAGTTVLVKSAVAPLQAEPKASSEQVSQSVAGQLATILETCDAWYRVRLADQYEGWMHEGYLGATALDVEQARAWLASAHRSFGCVVRDGETGQERALPFGARFAHDAEIVRGEVVDEDQIRRRFRPTGTSVCTSAMTWFKSAPYQWGGITPWGADCSGMVQAIFGLHGVAFPRDAHQQALLGDAIALNPDAWREGDLLFFSDRDDGRSTHVALVAHPGTLLHVAIGRGGFAVEKLEGARDPYTVSLMRRLRYARRLLETSS